MVGEYWYLIAFCMYYKIDLNKRFKWCNNQSFKVTREENDNGEVRIEITGSPDVIAKAKELITNTVNPMDRVTKSFGSKILAVKIHQLSWNIFLRGNP